MTAGFLTPWRVTGRGDEVGDGHISVLPREVCDALDGGLAPLGAPPRGVHVDVTCGAGGHIEAVLERYAPERVVAVDRDRSALDRARARLADSTTPILFIHAPFSALRAALAEHDIQRVHGIVADLGVSSMQLDQAHRGFSFRADAPLDMRMNPEDPRTVADVLAELDAPSLTRILREYGEEADAPRIARAIVAARPTTTLELGQVVTESMSNPQRRKLGMRIHPATKTFQALRIHLNDELGELDTLLTDAPEHLAVEGRLAIITFHSLEDRRVKRAFRRLCTPPAVPSGVPVLEADRQMPFALPRPYSKGLVAGPEEIERNPRSRSARLRVLQRIA